MVILGRLIQDMNTLVGRCLTPVNRYLGVKINRLYLRMHHFFSGSRFSERSVITLRAHFEAA